MPNRILRDWTDSFTISALDVNAERFFIRLIMKADDFGRFHADTRLLKANLFPLLPEIRETDISYCLAACEKAGVLRCYVDDKGRKYLEIANFRQRTRQSESKFPSPASRLPPPDSLLPVDDRQPTVNRPSTDRQPRTETETETIKEGETRTREGTPIRDALEEIFPGITADFRAGDTVTNWALEFKATPAQIKDFPGWMQRNLPMVALNHFTFRDHYHKSLKGDLPRENRGNGNGKSNDPNAAKRRADNPPSPVTKWKSGTEL